jgi:phenylpyruvate tautomerase PptA (4-oxalocrotonate tautomerase family)
MSPDQGVYARTWASKAAYSARGWADMPLVRIEILKGRTASERKRLLAAVHDALVEAFSIPEDDRTQRIVEHDAEDFEIPPGATDRYTLVEITAFPGRSVPTKRRLYQAVVRRLEALGVPSSDILVVVHEPPMENWGIRGGKPASEVDPGFRVDV